MDKEEKKRLEKQDYNQVKEVIDYLTNEDKNRGLNCELLLFTIFEIRKDPTIELIDAFHIAACEWDIA
jgi:hypothetical protein